MYKFAFTYLIKQDKKNWAELEVSLKLLHKNILSKLTCNYKIIILKTIIFIQYWQYIMCLFKFYSF